MRSVFVIVLAVAVLTSAAGSAPPPQPADPGLPMPGLPQIDYIESVTPNAGVFRTFQVQIVHKAVPKTVEEKVPVLVQEKVVVNGQEMIVTKTVYQTVVKTMNVAVQELTKVLKEWNVTGDTACDVAGNKLTKEEVFKRLQPGMAVLVMPSGQKLHPAHQRLFNKDTIVLTPVVQP